MADLDLAASSLLAVIIVETGEQAVPSLTYGEMVQLAPPCFELTVKEIPEILNALQGARLLKINGVSP